MKELMNNKDYLYGSMIKDFYFLGQVLGLAAAFFFDPKQGLQKAHQPADKGCNQQHPDDIEYGMEQCQLHGIVAALYKQVGRQEIDQILQLVNKHHGK